MEILYLSSVDSVRARLYEQIPANSILKPIEVMNNGAEIRGFIVRAALSSVIEYGRTTQTRLADQFFFLSRKSPVGCMTNTGMIFETVTKCV